MASSSSPPITITAEEPWTPSRSLALVTTQTLALAQARLKVTTRRRGVLITRLLAPAIAIALCAIVEAAVLANVKWRSNPPPQGPNAQAETTKPAALLQLPQCTSIIRQKTNFDIYSTCVQDGHVIAYATEGQLNQRINASMRRLAALHNLTFGTHVREYGSVEELASTILQQPGHISYALFFSSVMTTTTTTTTVYSVWYNETATNLVKYNSNTRQGASVQSNSDMFKLIGDDALERYNLASGVAAVVHAVDEVLLAHVEENSEERNLNSPRRRIRVGAMEELRKSNKQTSTTAQEQSPPMIAPFMLAPLLAGAFCVNLILTSITIAEEARLGVTSTLRRTGAEPLAMLLGNFLPFAVLGIVTALIAAAVGAMSNLQLFRLTNPFVFISLFTLTEWAHSAIGIALAVPCGRSVGIASLLGSGMMLIVILTWFIVSSSADYSNMLFASSFDVAYVRTSQFGDTSLAFAALFAPWQLFRSIQHIQESTLYTERVCANGASGVKFNVADMFRRKNATAVALRHGYDAPDEFSTRCSYDSSCAWVFRTRDDGGRIVDQGNLFELQQGIAENTVYRTFEIRVPRSTPPGHVAIDGVPGMHHSLEMLIADIFVYLFVAWYATMVLGGDAGAPLPPWFPLMPRFWGYSKPKSSISSDDPNSRTFTEAERALSASTKSVRTWKLSKSFQSVQAVKELTFSYPRGEVFAFLGANGAGKTTTISVLTGDLAPTHGAAYVCGLDIESESSLVRKCVGICQQHDALWPELTAREHVAVFSVLSGVTDVASGENCLVRVSLEADADRRAGLFSGGMKRRLMLALAALRQPDALFLDEPTTGMDPLSRREVWDVIHGCKENAAVLLTTHSMEEADRLGDSVGVLANGRLRAIGTPMFLKRRFGSGYQLSVVLSDSTPDAEGQVTAALTARCPGVQIVRNAGGTLVFGVPTISGGTIPTALEWLEGAGACWVRDVGVTTSTMEEVFLRLTVQSQELNAAVAGVGQDVIVQDALRQQMASGATVDTAGLLSDVRRLLTLVWDTAATLPGIRALARTLVHTSSVYPEPHGFNEESVTGVNNDVLESVSMEDENHQGEESGAIASIAVTGESQSTPPPLPASQASTAAASHDATSSELLQPPQQLHQPSAMGNGMIKSITILQQRLSALVTKSFIRMRRQRWTLRISIGIVALLVLLSTLFAFIQEPVDWKQNAQCPHYAGLYVPELGDSRSTSKEQNLRRACNSTLYGAAMGISSRYRSTCLPHLMTLMRSVSNDSDHKNSSMSSGTCITPDCLHSVQALARKNPFAPRPEHGEGAISPCRCTRLWANPNLRSMVDNSIFEIVDNFRIRNNSTSTPGFNEEDYPSCDQFRGVGYTESDSDVQDIVQSMLGINEFHAMGEYGTALSSLKGSIVSVSTASTWEKIPVQRDGADGRTHVWVDSANNSSLSHVPYLPSATVRAVVGAEATFVANERGANLPTAGDVANVPCMPDPPLAWFIPGGEDIARKQLRAHVPDVIITGVATEDAVVRMWIDSQNCDGRGCMPTYHDGNASAAGVCKGRLEYQPSPREGSEYSLALAQLSHTLAVDQARAAGSTVPFAIVLPMPQLEFLRDRIDPRDGVNWLLTFFYLLITLSPFPLTVAGIAEERAIHFVDVVECLGSSRVEYMTAHYLWGMLLSLTLNIGWGLLQLLGNGRNFRDLLGYWFANFLTGSHVMGGYATLIGSCLSQRTALIASVFYVIMIATNAPTIVGTAYSVTFYKETLMLPFLAQARITNLLYAYRTQANSTDMGVAFAASLAHGFAALCLSIALPSLLRAIASLARALRRASGLHTVEPESNDSGGGGEDGLGDRVDVTSERERVHRDLNALVSTGGIVVSNVHKSWPGKGAVLKGVSFAVPPGDGIFGLLGPNGAGKSTLIHMFQGSYAADAGNLFACGRSVRVGGASTPDLGYCAQHDRLLPDLTVEEHLTMAARLRGAPHSSAAARELAQLVELDGDAFRSQASQLSGGMRRRLSIGMALAGAPRVILLDEPTTGLDPESRSQVWRVIKREAQSRSVILTTHSMEEADALCSRVAVLSDGRLRCLGAPTELKHRYGGGVRLLVTVSDSSAVKDAVAFVQSSCPGATCERSVSDSAFYSGKVLITFKLASTSRLSSVFAAMLNDVEVARAGIGEWEVQSPTLEDVFVAACLCTTAATSAAAGR